MVEITVLRALAKLKRDESGHGELLVNDLVKVIGVILLPAGAAASEEVITIVGGVVLAVGIVAATIRSHMTIDYPIFDRLNALEGKSDED
jgi:hypothetical protein